MSVNNEDDVGSVAAVTTVRSALRFKLSSTEAGATVTSVSGFRVDFDVINKHDGMGKAAPGDYVPQTALHSTVSANWKS